MFLAQRKRRAKNTFGFKEHLSQLVDSLIADWMFPRVLELTYTAWDLQPFAQDCGYEGAPFR